MKTLLCESNPMCYGSSTVLLSIIDHIKSKTVCLATGVAKEVLENGRTEIIEVNNKSKEDVALAIKKIDFDCVLVVSNTTNLTLYKSLNKKIYFVHIHFFYPNANAQILKLTDILFVQNFWNLQHSSTAKIVGPLIKTPKIKSWKNDKILINLGGGESQYILPGINSDYAIKMLDLIIKLKSIIRKKEIVICGGFKIIETIRKKANENRIEAMTLSNDQYLDLLDRTEILFSSPGLNSIFEALYREIPIVFLPPQNVSQVYQLQEYEKAGLSLKGINLTLPNGALTEGEQTKSFLNEMTKKYSDDSFNIRQLVYLTDQLKYSQTSVYKIKAATAKIFLGKIGSNEVAEIINEENSNFFQNVNQETDNDYE